MDLKKISKTDSIFLYGEGAYYNLIVQALYDSGYSVRGVIDRKYSDGGLNDSFVRISDDQYFSHYHRNDDIVIVCIGDGVKHEEIAETLASRGVQWILYISTSQEVTIQYRSRLRNAYNLLFVGDITSIRVPRYMNPQRENIIVIDQRSDYTIFWCPTRFVYTDSNEDGMVTNYKQGLVEGDLWDKYINIPIESFEPYLNLYKSLSGQNVDDSEFYRMNRNTPKAREQLKINRRRLFEAYEFAFMYDFGFFTEGPTGVTWNPGGYFNIYSGKNRSCYLITKGYSELPVMCSNDDYKRFIDYLKVKNNE